MTASALETTISALLVPGKGVLAADESFPTLDKRFQTAGIPFTEKNRAAYRAMLFTTPELGQFISGAILFDETIHQQVNGNVSMPEALKAQGVVPGIKVDKGTAALPGFEKEQMTQGLDGLRERFATYRALGARFSKWRAVLAIGPHTPTQTCLDTNAEALALFAALSQEAQLVPIVEPEVLMDGDHTMACCEQITTAALRRVFDTLVAHRVTLEQTLLKTNMVLPGKGCPQQASVQEVAERTLRCLRRAVPTAVPGVLFLSGGQSDDAATQHLNAICAAAQGPWRLSFSYGRALQTAALQAWKGLPDHVPEAQQALHRRAQANSLALRGQYS